MPKVTFTVIIDADENIDAKWIEQATADIEECLSYEFSDADVTATHTSTES